MIQIKIVTEGGHFSSLEVKGHANSAPYGQDLICAGVSAVTLGGLNALLDGKSYDIVTKEGYVSLKASKPVSEHDRTVIETMIVQLESLAESHKDYVRLERTNAK
jgi:uncharacterized protein